MIMQLAIRNRLSAKGCLRRLLLACALLATTAHAQVQSESGSLPIPQNLAGSVPTGEATGDTLALTMLDAIQRGVKYNIGIVGAGEDIRAARAERLRALRELLPNVYSKVSASGQQVDLAAYGFSRFSRCSRRPRPVLDL